MAENNMYDWESFRDTVVESLSQKHIDPEEFIGGVLIISDAEGQFIVSSEASTEQVITLLKIAICAISNSYNKVPELKN